MTVILLAALALTGGCKDEEYNLDVADYKEFHLEAGRAMCAKMQECYAPFLRTLRPEFQRRVDEESCMKSMRQDLDRKIAVHTPEIQQLSRVCYSELLQRNCKEFIVGTVFIPACQALMEKTSAEFQKYPALLRELNRDRAEDPLPSNPSGAADPADPGDPMISGPGDGKRSL
ncbi:MAG: hypothetical protein KDK25_13880 [Leptospiraceae bacterium]|nr:hypothetical protein [Leptospiraceae bacterium]